MGVSYGVAGGSVGYVEVGARGADCALDVCGGSFVGDDGESARDLLPQTVEHHWAESADQQGFGWLVPVRKLSVLGVTEQADIDWLTPKLTPHPWKTYTDPLRLTGAVDDVPAAFVECVSWMRVYAAQADRARAGGWPVDELEQHLFEIEDAKTLVGLLLYLRERR